MAIINLLQGTYRQKVGETYGARWKNKTIAKAVPFSRAPQTHTQRAAVRAFEGLNRIAGALARTGYKYLGITNKNMLPHNAVAKWLKPMIRQHQFNPAGIQQIIPAGDLIRSLQVHYDTDTGVYSTQCDLAQSEQDTSDWRLHWIVCDQVGRTKFSVCTPWQSEAYSFFPQGEYGPTIYAVAFRSIPYQKTRKCDNSKIVQITIPQ